MKKIRFIIDSDLENVALVGMSIKKLCSLTPFSENQSFQIELCVVEAINNSIIHAYNGLSIYEVEVILSINMDHLMIEVCDTGKPMDDEVLLDANFKPFDDGIDNLDKISESGRGLGLIKELMDKVSYRSDDAGNRLTLLKYY